MKSVVRVSAGLVAAVGLVALMPAQTKAAEECRTFSAAGDGLSESVATLMATQGAVNVAEARGYHVVGEAQLIKCQPGGFWGTECYAKAKACKRVE